MGKCTALSSCLDKGIEYNAPLRESAPRIPEPGASNVSYYAQYDTLKEFAKGKRWTFCEIRPDAIIGLLPQNNAMNLAQTLGLWVGDGWEFWRDRNRSGLSGGREDVQGP